MESPRTNDRIILLTTHFDSYNKRNHASGVANYSQKRNGAAKEGKVCYKKDMDIPFETFKGERNLGPFRNGKKHGRWLQYNYDGQVLLEEH